MRKSIAKLRKSKKRRLLIIILNGPFNIQLFTGNLDC